MVSITIQLYYMSLNLSPASSNHSTLTVSYHLIVFLLKYNAIIHFLKEMGFLVWLSNNTKFNRFQAILLLGINLREMKDIKNCKQMFLAAFFIITESWKQYKWLYILWFCLFNISTVCKSIVTESRSVVA